MGGGGFIIRCVRVRRWIGRGRWGDCEGVRGVEGEDLKALGMDSTHFVCRYRTVYYILTTTAERSSSISISSYLVKCKVGIVSDHCCSPMASEG